MDADAEKQEVRLTAPDTTRVTIRLARATEVAATSRAEVLRECARLRLPGARVIEDAVYYTEGGEGRSCDLEWKSESGSMFSVRFAAVRVKEATIEFSLVAKPDDFPAQRATFTDAAIEKPPFPLSLQRRAAQLS